MKGSLLYTGIPRMAANTRRTATTSRDGPWAEVWPGTNSRRADGNGLHRARRQGTRSVAGDFRDALNAHSAFASVNDEVCQHRRTAGPLLPGAARTARVRSAI